MTAPANRPSQREAAIAAARQHLREGGALSLDSAAKAAGLTKPGLMYHFASKEALVTALVEYVASDYNRTLLSLLPDGVTDPTPRQRVAAYVEWSITHAHDAADLVTLSDPKLRIVMSQRWSELFRPWLEIPLDTPDRERTTLQAVRLIADGCWFCDASGIVPIPEADRAALLARARQLLSEIDAGPGAEA